jgi:hypothetical protein
VLATRRAQCDQTGHKNDVESSDSTSLTYVRANFPVVFLFLLFLPSKPCYPCYLGRALLYQLIVDFPFEHKDIFTKENIYNKSGTAG